MGSTSEEELVGLVATFTRAWRAGGSATLTLTSSEGHLGANLDISIGHFGGGTRAPQTPGPTIHIKDDEQEEGEEVHKDDKKDRESVVNDATIGSQTNTQQATIEEYQKFEDLLKEVETNKHVEEVEAKEHEDGADIEEHVAIPGPDNQPALSDSDSGVLDMNSEEGRGMKLSTEVEELEEKAPLHPKAFPGSMPAGHTCTVIARGTIKRSPHPAMREEEAEAVRRYLEADVGSVSDIKVSCVATEPEEAGVYCHVVRARFQVDTAVFQHRSAEAFARHISEYEWLRSNQSMVRLSDVQFHWAQPSTASKPTKKTKM